MPTFGGGNPTRAAPLQTEPRPAPSGGNAPLMQCIYHLQHGGQLALGAVASTLALAPSPSGYF